MDLENKYTTQNRLVLIEKAESLIREIIQKITTAGTPVYDLFTSKDSKNKEPFKKYLEELVLDI